MARQSKAVEVVRVLKSTGVPTRLRLRLEPRAGERVNIVRAHRKRRGETRCRRIREHGLRNVPFAQLRLRHRFADLFPGEAP